MIAGDAYPKPWPLFWAAAALALGYLTAALALRWRAWRRGMAAPPGPDPDRGRVAGIWLAEVLAQRQLLALSRSRWGIHLCIAWGFLALCLLSALHVLLQALEAGGLARGPAAWFLRGGGRAALKIWGNAFGIVLLAGLLPALARRFVRRAPAEAQSRETDTPLVLFLLFLTLTGFALEGLRLLAASGAAPAARLGPWLTALWTIHGLGGLALVAWLPHSRLMHALLAPLVIALNARAEHTRRDLYWPRTPKLGATGSPKA